jgi:hypothetical protein
MSMPYPDDATRHAAVAEFAARPMGPQRAPALPPSMTLADRRRQTAETLAGAALDLRWMMPDKNTPKHLDAPSVLARFVAACDDYAEAHGR